MSSVSLRLLRLTGFSLGARTLRRGGAGAGRGRGDQWDPASAMERDRGHTTEYTRTTNNPTCRASYRTSTQSVRTQAKAYKVAQWPSVVHLLGGSSQKNTITMTLVLSLLTPTLLKEIGTKKIVKLDPKSKPRYDNNLEMSI